MAAASVSFPNLGVGLAYRPELSEFIFGNSEVNWVEIIGDRFLPLTDERRKFLSELAASYAVVPHFLEMSIGSVDAPDPSYVAGVSEIVELVRAPWFSDHLCFVRAGDIRLSQLTPLHQTLEVAHIAAAHARDVQDRVGVPFLLENITKSFDLPGSLSDEDFMAAFLERSGCYLLLDLTNLYINAVNYQLDPHRYLQSVPLERVVQIHLAGGEERDGRLVDTHSASVPDPVWKLLETTLSGVEVPGILLERDSGFEDEEGIGRDLRRAKTIATRVDDQVSITLP